MTVHTIPVPEGWSTEQAWEAIKRGDTLPPPARWDNVNVPDEPNTAPPLPTWLWYWVVEPVLSLLSWIAYGRRK